MPILDIRTGNSNGVNAAATTLIESYHARSKAISDNLKSLGEGIINYALIDDKFKTSQSQRDLMGVQKELTEENAREQKLQNFRIQKENEIKYGLDENANPINPNKKTLYEEELEANIKNTKSGTNLNYNRAELIRKQKQGQHMQNAIQNAENVLLVKNSPVETIYNAGMGGLPGYEQYFMQTGLLTQRGKNGKLISINPLK